MEAAFQSGFVSATLQVLFEKFVNFAAKEMSIMLGADAGLRKLQRTLLRIQSTLDYVEDGRVRFPNDNSKKAWKMWAEDLSKLCYDADDLLDELSLQIPNFNGTDQISADQVREILSSPLNIVVPRTIEDIWKKVEEMAAEMNSIFMNEMVKFEEPTMLRRGPLYNSDARGSITSSLVDEDLIFGREKEKGDIINLLRVCGSQGSITDVIPITGMAGLGKTALAQAVYNCWEVQEHFELRMWVSVSVEFDHMRIAKAILESAMSSTCGSSNFNLIQNKLKNILASKRFLLVLDDFWSEKYGDWEVLRMPFKYTTMGSKVIVTTRSTIVSSIVGTVPAYHLQMLPNEDCWQVMSQRAFSNANIDDQENYEILEQLGRLIAAKCNGLPLAAQALGSVLHCKSDLESWLSILESELWDLPQEKNEIFPAMALSYHHLPVHLRKSFAYCAIFPRNHEFEVDDLVLRWIAEGFVEPTGKRRLEDIGRDYFMDLLRRSFFQCTEGGFNNPRKCKMHDLIHGMAQTVSEGICFRMEDDLSHWYPLYRNVRHLSLNHESMELIAQTVFPKYQSLRTFILVCKRGNGIRKPQYDLLLKFRSLRVLDLSDAGIEELPDSIDHLKHLRYLNLSQNKIQRLPQGITRLLGLQTLKLINCYKFLSFPTNLRNLTNLRHLHLNIWRRLICMPPNMGRLTNLQTLHSFIVGRDEGYGLEELENLKFLQGSLCITNLENVPNLARAKKANLGEKRCLKKLELEWTDVHNRINREEVLASLEPHVNLKELVITNYCGNMFPGWLSAPEHKFSCIHLQRCRSCTILPPLGHLPLLKLLQIENMSSVVQIDRGFCSLDNSQGFPSLESLKFKNLPRWIEWHGLAVYDMPHLCDLIIEDCPKLSSLPELHNLRSLEKLKIERCPSLESLPAQLPGSLRHLIISGIAHLREWNGLGGNEMPYLHVLIVRECPGLISLPSLHNLHSLEELKIISCPSLQALPERLPQSIRNLIILDSCIIKERCKMGEGQDWLKIRSIQRVEIDGEKIQVAV